MIRLKTILLEDDKKKSSEDPDKILVKSKESGRSYYINKDSFDPAKHEKPKPKKASKEDKEKQEKEKKKKEAGGIDLMAGAGVSDEKDDKNGDKKGGEKETPEEKLENAIGSNVFVKEKEQNDINKRSYELRPDLKQKLLAYDYQSLFDEYNELQVDGASDDELKGISKKIQIIAIAKFGALSTKINDVNTIKSAKIYKANSSVINTMLQTGQKLMSRAEIKKELSNKGIPSELLYELNKTQAIYDMDDHFKTEGAKLENDITVYKSVVSSIVDDFVKAKKWVDNGFVSTSLNPIIGENGNSVERNPLLKIHLKRGDAVLMLPCSEDEFCIETEITLPRSCAFVITDYDDVKNAYDVSVEYPNA